MGAQKRSAVGAVPGRDQSKRQPAVGKRKLADAEAELVRGARRATAELRPPEADHLVWLGSREAVGFMWRYADGSTSARPHLGGAAAAHKESAFDPYSQSSVVGCSMYSKLDDDGRCVHWDLRPAASDAATLEAAWFGLTRLLSGEQQAIVVAPNAQLVMRTLLLVLPDVLHAARQRADPPLRAARTPPPAATATERAADGGAAPLDELGALLCDAEALPWVCSRWLGCAPS